MYLKFIGKIGPINKPVVEFAQQHNNHHSRRRAQAAAKLWNLLAATVD
jgi:hypothetical protein